MVYKRTLTCEMIHIDKLPNTQYGVVRYLSGVHFIILKVNIGVSYVNVNTINNYECRCGRLEDGC